MMAGIGKITYVYTPDAWSQDEFLRLGGFTVVFLNYNKAAFIEKSVASALAQDFPLCEMFFMDDASTDGSGDTMERLVREYRGRHKVTVVRNTENQHICGQWNIVSKLATGNWFGMFCGDDESFPNRVQKAAELIRQYPTIKGLCANGTAVNLATDAVRPVDHHEFLILSKGTDALYPLIMQYPPIAGTTAFWHRSLFESPLTRAPMDDVLLRWVLQGKSYGCEQPVFAWDGATRVVKYTVGSGITSAMRSDTEIDKSTIHGWIVRKRAMNKFDRLMIKTVKGVLQYAQSNDFSSQIVMALKGKLLYNRILVGSTFSRLMMLPQIVFCVSNRKLESELKRLIATTWVKLFFQEFFGLHMAGFVSVYMLKREVSTFE